MEMAPCVTTSTGLHVFIVTMNVLQSVAIAWLAQRAARRDSRERRRSRDNSAA